MELEEALPHPDGVTITASEGIWSAVITESDPIFGASAAASITASDISAWNGKQDALTAGSNITISGNTISAAFTFTESDPVFGASAAASITASDISNWNAMVGVPSTSGASEGDVLTVDRGGDAVWAAPSTLSEIEFESTHSSDEDYVVTKISGDDSIEVREMLYDDGDYINGNRVYIGAGELGASDDNGDYSIIIGTDMITFAGLDSNDDPINSTLSMGQERELLWDGDPVFPACPTTTDGHYMLCATVSLGEVVYEWEPVATASGVSF